MSHRHLAPRRRLKYRILFALAFWFAVVNFIVAAMAADPARSLALWFSMLIVGSTIGYTANTLYRLRQLSRAATNTLVAEHTQHTQHEQTLTQTSPRA